MGDLSYSAPVDFRITQTPPDGLPPNVKGAFEEVYNAFQQVIQSFVNNCGIGPQPISLWPLLAGNSSTILASNMGRLYVIASEAIAAGAAVSLFLNAGILKCRNANGTNNTKPVDGFASAVIAAGDVGEIVVGSGIAVIAGLVIGTRYFLSTVNGLITNVPPVAAGNIEQYIGIAVDGTHLFFNLGYWIQH